MKNNTFYPKVSGQRGSILFETIRFVCVGLYRLSGWKFKGTLPEKHLFVAIGGPHTSNWDFAIFLSLAFYLRVKLNFFAKSSLFEGPFGWFFRWLGGQPVYRDENRDLVSQAAAFFDGQDQFVLAIAPEGTRSKGNKWKSGFYHIATKANVPIISAFIDAPNKTSGIFDMSLHPVGDYEADMKKFIAIFDTVEGVRPEKRSGYL